MSIKRLFANMLIGLTSIPAAKKVLLKMGRHQGIVFMLHRFDLSCYGIEGPEGHDLKFLEDSLIWLKDSGHNIVSVDEMVRAAREGTPIDNAVAFTIDDGFFDHALVAEKVFAKLGIPVTIFLVTDCVDGKYWLIESRIRFIVKSASLADLKISIHGKVFKASSRTQLSRELVWYAKTLTLEQGEQFVAELASLCGVSVPQDAPDEFKPLTWDDARRLEKMGIQFGAHTRHHPTLSLEADSVAEEEILGALSRLTEELSQPSNVFCYPTGRREDFSVRDVRIIENQGLLGALSTEVGYLSFDEPLLENEVYEIPRLGWPKNRADLFQMLYYFEYLKPKSKKQG